MASWVISTSRGRAIFADTYAHNCRAPRHGGGLLPWHAQSQGHRTRGNTPSKDDSPQLIEGKSRGACVFDQFIIVMRVRQDHPRDSARSTFS
jgi:hypothetical protein